jgi:hypothetical protein
MGAVDDAEVGIDDAPGEAQAPRMSARLRATTANRAGRMGVASGMSEA